MDAFMPIVQLWPIFVSVAIFGVWVVRMEGKVQSVAKDIVRLENRMNQERADTRAALDDLADMLREQNRDIKILLGRGHIQHWTDRTVPPR